MSKNQIEALLADQIKGAKDSFGIQPSTFTPDIKAQQPNKNKANEDRKPGKEKKAKDHLTNTLKSSKTPTTKRELNDQQKIKTSLYLAPEQLRALKIHCAEEGIPMTLFIEEAIVAKMKNDRRKREKDGSAETL